jgi:hypothetical protein
MQPIDAVVDFRAQSITHPFPHHGALLARDRTQIALDRRIERSPEVGVEVRFARPVAPARRKIAEFEHRYGKRFRQLHRLAFECAQTFGIGRDRASAHRKGIRYQG